ncbi:late endosomal/lysosomal adaptor and MAPK and MTOR activator-domain-containing protein [Xylariaceae sp. FL0255]|nr:late endosomal/lysosomal adaptor and MAPK and MTOR activator-domain-containing protein [Xylariaceae sp. FL0255]
MGVCASCLGRRGNDSIDEDDVSRLLFDDPNHIQYGSFAENNLASQADPLELQREAEALQRVVARTSNNLVDVFEVAPRDSQRAHSTIFNGQDALLARYQHIINTVSDIPADETSTTAVANPAAVEWVLSEDDNSDAQEHSFTVKEASDEPLVGTFADAAAAVA